MSADLCTDSGIGDENGTEVQSENVNASTSTDGVFTETDGPDADSEELNDDQPKAIDENSNSISNVVQNVLKTRFTSTRDMVKLGATKFGFAATIWFLGYFDFSLLWVFCGVCLSMFVVNKASKRKAAAEVIKRNTDDPKKFIATIKEMYRLDGKRLPSWIYYPDVEKAEWLNKIIEQLWPYVGNYVKKLVTEKVEKSIQESSSLLSGFSFTDVDLGDRAPRVAGVKVYGNTLTRRNEIVMDLQIVYDGDCNFGISVNRLKAGITDLRIRGLVRAELHPLLEEMPLVGAVSVAFVQDPIIDFNLTDLANLFDLPGFDILLRGSISDMVGAMFVLPERYVVKLCPDIDISRLRFPLPQGVLRVHVIDAKNLEEKDRKVLGFGGGSDPFVTIKVGHNQKFKTSIQHSINPTWDESFDILISDVQSSNIHFTLHDDDGALNKADYLGCASLPVKTVFEQGIVDESIQLSDVTTGSLHVRMEWYGLSTDPNDLEEALKQSGSNSIAYSSFLNIYVDGAQHLPDNTEESFDPSPVLKIHLPGREPLKTQTALHTSNPVWEENFRVLIHNPLFDQVKFELKDKRVRMQVRRALDRTRTMIKRGSVSTSKVEDSESKAGNLGNFQYSIKQLLHARDMTIEHPFALRNSGHNSVLNVRMSLRILKLKSKPDVPKPSDGIHFDTTDNGVHSSETTAKHETVPKPTSSTNASETHSESNVSVTNSSMSVEFEASAEALGANHDNLKPVERSPSIGSEMSNIGEVDNLRKRLNAKLNNNSTDKQVDHGLGRIQLTIRYNRGNLIVLVVKAENLIICDEDDSTSDPYVRVYIIPDKKNRKKTKVVKNNLNPTFDHRLEFDISAKEVSRRKLQVTVKNQTGFLSSEKVLMGQVAIDLSEMDLSQPTTEWYNLQLPETS